MKYSFVLLSLILACAFVLTACTETTPRVQINNPSNETTQENTQEKTSNQILPEGETGETSENKEMLPATPETNNTNQNDSVLPSTGELKTIRIDAYDYGFKIDGPEINAGDRVKLIVTSTSGTHGFSMPGLNINLKPVSPGKEMTTEFVADQAGSYDYFCNVPCGSGHRSMRGTLIVK